MRDCLGGTRSRTSRPESRPCSVISAAYRCPATAGLVALLWSRNIHGILHARAPAHASCDTHTSKLYDRGADRITLDEIERIVIT